MLKGDNSSSQNHLDTGYTILALKFPECKILCWGLSLLSWNSVWTEVSFSASTTITEGCRSNSGLLFLHSLYLCGTCIVHGTSLYGVVSKILALIFSAAVRVPHKQAQNNAFPQH